MEIERFNPEGLSSRPFYHHVVRSSSKYLVHISGQVGIDATGAVVGPGNFAAHVDQAFSNLGVALEAAGVAPDQVAKVTTFVVDYDHEVKWPIVNSAHSAFFEGCEPAWTVVGVEALARPDLMIEIEATAIYD